MMRGITVESISNYDPITGHYHNRGEAYTIRKAKGKITLAEVQQALREKHIEGLFAIMVPVSEDCYDGWTDSEPVGDAVDVWMIDQDMECPVCSKLSPIMYWCPECGSKVRQEVQ